MLPELLQAFRARRSAMFGAAMLVILTLLGLSAQLLAPHDPMATDILRTLEAPSVVHWLGTDDIGRDILSRMLFGIRITLTASALAVGIAALIGIPLGLIAGYRRGGTDEIIMRFNDALMSFPALVLAISIIGFLGPDLRNAMIAIGIVFAPRFVRVTRGLMLALREEDFMSSAQVVGCSPARAIVRHALPNMAPTLIVEVTLLLGLAILAEASLSFLGLGVQPPEASLGALVGRGFVYLSAAPLYPIAPASGIVLLVMSFNFIGDGLDKSIATVLGHTTSLEASQS